MKQDNEFIFQENLENDEVSEFIEYQKERNKALGKFIEKISEQMKKNLKTIDTEKIENESKINNK